MPILDRLQDPAELRGLSEAELVQLAAEIRETIIRTVAVTGGHLGSSLGVVEITLALHRLLESPRDHIVWDTGHQAYAHKLLTGRRDRFGTLRQIDGIGGFPRRSESPHDVMDGGHAGTGMSIAQGLATARDIRHSMERIAVVVGDAALLSGLSLEALNDIGHRRTQLLIVLNDNEMSISPSVGALSKYLSEIKLSPAWHQSTDRLRHRDGADARRRAARRRAVAAPAAVGGHLRAAGPAVRGPRHHVHRRHARSRPPPPGGDVPPCARARRPRDRPRPDPEGQGLQARRGRPGLLPRRGPAPDDARTGRGHARPDRCPGRAQRRPDDLVRRRGRFAHAVPRGRRGRPAVRVGHGGPPDAPAAGGRGGDGRRHRRLRADGRREEDPELHGVLCGRAARPGRRGPADRRHHGRHAHRHGPGQVPGAPTRSGSSTSGSPSSTPSPWPPASRSAGCGPSWRSTRRSCSAPSTRPSTTSARTTRRSSSP